MSILDKVVAAVTPPESEEARRKARQKARRAAEGQDWLAHILDHHEQIEAAFRAVELATTDVAARRAAQAELAVLLSAHANAEEAVIYPALIHFGHKMHGTAGYTEQAGAKANLGELEYLNPLSQEYADKLAHIRGAVAHHVYEEENDRFLDLKKLSAPDQARLTQRYAEEFARFAGMHASDRPVRPNEILDADLTAAPRQT